MKTRFEIIRGGRTIVGTRRTLGANPVTGRKLFGYTVTCSCGWRWDVNGDKRTTVSTARAHFAAHQSEYGYN